MAGRKIMAVFVPGHGAQAEGEYVIRNLGTDLTPNYAVHFLNHQDGGYHQGTYCGASLQKAIDSFKERSAWVWPYRRRIGHDVLPSQDAL